MLRWALCLAFFALCAADNTTTWELTSHIGRAVYLSNIHVKTARCGRRIPTGNYRLQITLERDHFQGNTALRGWLTTTPSPEPEWPLAFFVDLQHEDQTRSAVRWTWEARNRSWATWERLYRAEGLVPRLLEEDSDQHCMILFPKMLPSSRTYRKDPCDHLLCMTIHHMGTDTYPATRWPETLPYEFAVALFFFSLFLLWLFSGWVSHPLLQQTYSATFLIPFVFLAYVSYARLQGLQELGGGRALVYGIHWGFGEGLTYGTDPDQLYHYELTLQFESHSLSFKSTTVTGMAVTRSPDEIIWPEYLSWPVPPEPLPAHTVVTARAKVFADGRAVESEYVLTFDAAGLREEPLLCATAGETPQPRFCLKAAVVQPKQGASVGLLAQMPGLGLMGYGAIIFVIFFALRKRKVPKGDDGEDKKEGEDDEDDDIDAKLAKKHK